VWAAFGSRMDESPWWPSGIVTEDSQDSSSDRIQTVFGTLETWDYQDCLAANWWQKPPSEGIIWGSWPKVSEIEILHQDRKGYLLRINENQIARITPINLGNDLSRLMQYPPWREALEGLMIRLPSMVYHVENNDRVVVYDCRNLAINSEDFESDKLAANLGTIHSALHDFATPNTERRWNDRLKDIESELKVTTLWRAPHSKFTVGLPRLNLDLALLCKEQDELLFIADVRSPVEHLMCHADRLPGLADLMLIEQQISFAKGMDENDRKSMLKAYLARAPKSYSHKKAVSTLMGGPWIWRYHAVLFAMGEARFFGDEELGKKAQKWLNDVSRIQAHLGVLRLWKSGLWGGIIGVIIAFFAWRMESTSPTLAGIAGVICLLGAFACNIVYWSKDPQPY
jgi:hypothetical protein